MICGMIAANQQPREAQGDGLPSVHARGQEPHTTHLQRRCRGMPAVWHLSDHGKRGWGIATFEDRAATRSPKKGEGRHVGHVLADDQQRMLLTVETAQFGRASLDDHLVGCTLTGTDGLMARLAQAGLMKKGTASRNSCDWPFSLCASAGRHRCGRSFDRAAGCRDCAAARERQRPPCRRRHRSQPASG
jgi:hypothetical protein